MNDLDVTRHWLVYPDEPWRHSSTGPTVVTTKPAHRHGYRIEGPFVLEAEQPLGAVADAERLRALLRRCYPIVAPNELSKAIERELGLPPFSAARRGQS